MSTKTVPVDEKVLYRPVADPVLIDVPAFDFVVVDGSGDPSSSASFQSAIQAVYAFSYPVVIALKRSGLVDLKVRPLEALWWADDVAAFDATTEDRAAWHWTAMIRQPDDLPQAVVDAAWRSVRKKVGEDLARGVRLERFEEGLSVQLMHYGPYAAEGPRIAAMHQFVAAHGLHLRGRHHEIYLSDPRRSSPAKMRTILRHPVAA